MCLTCFFCCWYFVPCVWFCSHCSVVFVNRAVKSRFSVVLFVLCVCLVCTLCLVPLSVWFCQAFFFLVKYLFFFPSLFCFDFCFFFFFNVFLNNKKCSQAEAEANIEYESDIDEDERALAMAIRDKAKLIKKEVTCPITLRYLVAEGRQNCQRHVMCHVPL